MKRIHVVAAVIRGENNRILIAKRPDHLHMGGLWEFPGGKVEIDESPLAALKRELKEEVDLEILDAKPLMHIQHDYSDKSILLDVWEVFDFAGLACGKEGQEVRWVLAAELCKYEFPSANRGVVAAISTG